MRERFLAHDRSFAAVTGAAPRLVSVMAADAHEGPVYAADVDALYFTSLPRVALGPAPAPPIEEVRHLALGGTPRRAPQVAIRRIALDGRRFPLERDSLETIRPAANAANGMALDAAGRLIICEQGCFHEPARISRMDRAIGVVETLVAAWRGMPFNSPNDVVVARDGAIWFTDPSYGHLQGFRPPPSVGDHVYRLDPATGRAAVVADRFDKPNGLAFSADERVLYVGDSGANQEPGSFHPNRPHRVLAFDVRDGRHLERERLFAVIGPGIPDGITVDADERVYVSCATGVLVFNPDGDLIGEIRVPGAVNFTFGGVDRDVLFITADSRVWAAELATCGPAPNRALSAASPTGA